MKFIRLKSLSLSGTLVLGSLVSSSTVVGGTWSRTVLGQGRVLVELGDGIPVLDVYGDAQPLLPNHYEPSAVDTAAGLNVLRFATPQATEPIEVDGDGYPILGDYFRLDYGVLSGNAWTLENPFTEALSDVVSPRFASRMDDTLSTFYWKESFLTIDTFEISNPARLTLPIPADRGAVAIDANGGVHILSINVDYELWHRYFLDGALSSVKLSDGPVCALAAVAGERDECHVAYTTFSEDLNLNEELDEGEDVNANSLLDLTPNQLLYQLVDANVPATVEIVAADSIIGVCYLDLLFSTTYGLKIAYADPVTNSIRLAERSSSTWSKGQISSSIGSYGPLALAVQADGDGVVSFATQDGLKLSLVEEDSGVWTESVIRETTVGAYFTGTDVVVRANGDVVVLAVEKNTNSYLAAYTQSVLPSLLATEVQPVSIRPAFIVTWPTPDEDVTQQVLQSSGDLSDPDRWEDLEQKNWYQWNDRVALETVVEQEAQKFYRVLEISE